MGREFKLNSFFLSLFPISINHFFQLLYTRFSRAHARAKLNLRPQKRDEVFHRYSRQFKESTRGKGRDRNSITRDPVSRFFVKFRQGAGLPPFPRSTKVERQAFTKKRNKHFKEISLRPSFCEKNVKLSLLHPFVLIVNINQISIIGNRW